MEVRGLGVIKPLLGRRIQVGTKSPLEDGVWGRGLHRGDRLGLGSTGEPRGPAEAVTGSIRECDIRYQASHMSC